LPVEDLAQVGVGVEAGGRSHGHQPATVHEREQRSLPGDLAGVLEHHVHAAAAGEGLHLLQEVGLLVVDGVVGPERKGLLALLLAPRGGDDARAHQAGDLDGRAPHARPGRVDEHGLAGPDPRPPHQRVPGGEEDQGDAGSLLEGHAARLGQHVGHRDRDPLGVPARGVLAEDGVLSAERVQAPQALLAPAAGGPRIEHHLHAGLHPAELGPGPDGLHHAGHVRAEHVRHGQLETGPSGADPDVEVVQRHRAHAHDHAPGPGHRVGQLRHLEDFWATVGPDHHRLHRHLLHMESHRSRQVSLRSAPSADNGFLMTIPILAALLGASAALKVGDKAPDFTLPGTDGQPVTLSKLLARGPVILAFFPKAFTPG
jgi:hypothetical protein